MLKGRVPTEKKAARKRYRELRCWNVVAELWAAMETGSIRARHCDDGQHEKKNPVYCEATVTIRRYERDKSDIEYYGRVPRPLLEQVLEQQVEDGHAREQLSDLHGKKRKAAGMKWHPETLMKRTVACQT